MDLDATPYRYFLAIAETRSFRRAADQLHVSQPALSARIKEFERRLGFQLFDRTSRQVELTAQGQLFLGNARKLVAETLWARRAADHIRDNELLIGVSFYASLIPERNALTDGFMRGHPDISMQITTWSDQAVSNDLQQGLIEVGIVLEDEVTSVRRASSSTAVNDTFERLTVASRDVTILFPVEHPLAEATDIDLSALRGDSVVMIDRTHGVALCQELYERLLLNDINTIRPPEGHAMAVERYAQTFRKPAICLGWFSDYQSVGGQTMVSRKVQGLDVLTKLVLKRSGVEHRSGATLFWNTATSIQTG